MKRDRGRINHVDEDQGYEYWARRDYTTETDQSILAHLERMKEVHSALLSDPDLARLHAAAVSWHREKIGLLLKQVDYRKLFERITGSDEEDALFHYAVPAPMDMAGA